MLRPGIEKLVAADLDLMQPFFEILARGTGDQMAGSMLQLLDGLRQQLGEELDLRNEARALADFRVLTTEIDLPLVVVPEPYPELSGQNVLTMEYLRGVPIDDLAAVAELGYDPAPLVEQVVRGGFFGDDGPVGQNPRRRPRGQPAPARRWSDRHHRLGHRRAARPRATHLFFPRLLDAVLGDEDAWPDITVDLTKTYGRVIQEGLGLDDVQLTVFIRSLIEPTLTRPLSAS